jgi:hypothetical protein
LVSKSLADGYLLWKLCLQVCARLLQALMQGVLSVVGHTR